MPKSYLSPYKTAQIPKDCVREGRLEQGKPGLSCNETRASGRSRSRDAEMMDVGLKQLESDLSSWPNAGATRVLHTSTCREQAST